MARLVRKCKFIIDKWNYRIRTPYTIEGVRKIKVRLVSYTTENSGNKTLAIKFLDFSSWQQGLFIKNDTSNDRYFFTMPLNDEAQVVNTYFNYQDEFDIDVDHTLPTINEINLEVLINDVPSNDITESNPVIVEIGFYA